MPLLAPASSSPRPGIRRKLSLKSAADAVREAKPDRETPLSLVLLILGVVAFVVMVSVN